MNMKKLMKRPVVMAGAGLGALYLLTRNASAEGPTPSPSPYQSLSPSQTSSFNAHLYTNVGDMELSDISFRRMMEDIAEIDGRRNITWQVGFMNPMPIPNEINLAKAKIIQGNLDNALTSEVNMTANQRFVLNQWMTMVTGLISEMEGTSSASENLAGLGAMYASPATRRYTRAIGGMKSWSKNLAQKMHEAQANDMTREQTLANMRMGMDINLYQPLDTYDESEYPSNDMNSSDDIGSALVHTRNSMRRLL